MALSVVRNVVLDLLFPPRCAGCHQRGRWLCDQCAGTIRFIEPPICPRCGQPNPTASLCRDCRLRPLAIRGIRSVAYLEGPLRKAIHRLKYRGATALAEPLAAYMADYLEANPLRVDLVMPVPLHPRRERDRGFNQSLLLARPVAAALDLSVDGRGLERIRETAPQIDLDVHERRANVRDAFRANPSRVAGRRVLLVDDVCTTGATMEACSRALAAAGARAVWGFSLARGH